MRTVAVIGGGAAGMMAAITAAGEQDQHVILLERQQRVGRKLLSTGNGRCNLTNLKASEEHYHGDDPAFVRQAMGQFSVEDTLQLFSGMGLITRAEEGGRVYPLSNSANSVVDVLRFAMEGAGVEVRTASPVAEVRRDGKGFQIRLEEETLRAEKVIVACGGSAGAKLGGVQDGYRILQSLGHTRTKLFPSLVQLTARDNRYPRAMKGVKAQAELTLSGEAKGTGRGEILFTEKGVSGPAIFDLSRCVSVVPEGRIDLTMDFMEGYSETEIAELLKKRCAALPEKTAGELLVGTVHNRLGKMLVKYAQVDGNRTLRELSEDELKRVAHAMKGFTLSIKGTEGFEQAQVTAGGIRTSEFDPATMQSRIVPGLYACGEVLDIDGDCGGFNLQWAWSSGRLAGRLLP